ncbi:MAG: TMEM175 family protein [Bacteroidota bacterium]
MTPAPDPSWPLGRDGFYHRGLAPSRLESFSDAVFAFSVTLLVISLDVPQTFDELKVAMAGLLGFAFSFAMILMLWRIHDRYFRRFDLDDDGVTIWLNSILLFLVLFFVYPLKFVFTLTSTFFVGTEILDGVRPLEPGQGIEMMRLYGTGFVAVFLLFALMYANALRQADALRLSAEERIRTRNEVEKSLLTMGIGVLSVAATLAPAVAWLSPWVYFLIAPVQGLYGWRVAGARVRRLWREQGRIA